MPSPVTPKQLEELLPRACLWASDQEERILAQGIALTPEQHADAKSTQVKCPERVRLLRVTRIPMPEDIGLRQAAQATGLISPATIGLTLRYGIFIRDDHWGDRTLVAHELAHTMQYERLGGIEAFLRQYLLECVTVGYPAAPMEQEAIRLAASIGSDQRGKIT